MWAVVYPLLVSSVVFLLRLFGVSFITFTALSDRAGEMWTEVSNAYYSLADVEIGGQDWHVMDYLSLAGFDNALTVIGAGFLAAFALKAFKFFVTLLPGV